jgi:hypothetical protein
VFRTLTAPVLRRLPLPFAPAPQEP